MRWIWIDKFIEFTPRTSATAIKCVSLAEEHLHDLYPDFPIVPHSLIVEGGQLFDCTSRNDGRDAGELDLIGGPAVINVANGVRFAGCSDVNPFDADILLNIPTAGAAIRVGKLVASPAILAPARTLIVEGGPGEDYPWVAHAWVRKLVTKGRARVEDLFSAPYALCETN